MLEIGIKGKTQFQWLVEQVRVADPEMKTFCRFMIDCEDGSVSKK